MRNGDYQPTRFDAQSDAVTTVFGHKVDSNPENTVGLMSMAGKGSEVLVTHTREVGKILQALHTARQKLGGSSDISTAISVAQLALKHRANKNTRQRIIVFVGSPIAVDVKALVKLAKKLKKNNVAVDVVSFGEESENADRLREFIENVESSENSHLVTVLPGPGLLSDAVISSSILAGDVPIPGGMEGVEATGGAGPSTSRTNDYEFGVDPNLDPELAMALRMSLEEERARQLASSSTTAVPAAPSEPAQHAEPLPALVPADATEDDEEALLQQAIAMSTTQPDGHEDVVMGNAASAPVPVVATSAEDEEMNEEEEIARAIEMSMRQPEEKQS